MSTRNREKEREEAEKCNLNKKGRIQCCPPSFASVAAETKIRRGVQAPQHRRTSNHAAQAALAIAAPPRLSPSPSGPPLQGYSNGLSLSLSCILSAL